MKKNLKALLALVLALCMLTLTACGSQPAQETENPTEEASTSETKTEEPAKEEVVESKYPEYLNLDGYRPIVKEGEEITLKVAIAKNPSTTISSDDAWFTHFIEEKLNINLEIEQIDWSARAEKINLIMASGELPDIMITFGFTPNQIVKYGIDEEMLLPVSDYMNEELTPNIIAHFESNPNAELGHTASDGKIYTVPQLSANNFGFGGTIPQGYRMFVDTKYMEAAGYETVPEDIDGFLDMLRDFKEVGDKIGVDEVYPMLGSSSYGYVFKNAFGWMAGSSTNDVAPVWDVEEGKVVIPASQEKYQEYVKLLNTLYTEGLIHPDTFTLDSAAWKALMVERKGGVWSTSAPYTIVSEKENGWGDFIGLTPLKSEHNPEGLVRASYDYAANGYYHISADTEYPEVCMRLMDYLCSPEGLVYASYGCPAGSEDTLGMIDGYTVENNQLVYGEDAAAFESALMYKLNTINLGWQYLANDYQIMPHAFELVGETYVDQGLDYENNGDDHYRHILATACEGRLVTPMPNAFMDGDDSARFSDLQTVLNDYVISEVAKFVVGQRPLDELPAFQEELKALGLEEFIQLCEEAYAGYAGPQ